MTVQDPTFDTNTLLKYFKPTPRLYLKQTTSGAFLEAAPTITSTFSGMRFLLVPHPHIFLREGSRRAPWAYGSDAERGGPPPYYFLLLNPPQV